MTDEVDDRVKQLLAPKKCLEKDMTTKEFEQCVIREKLSDLEHEQWASWVKYILANAQQNNDGSVTFPAEQVKRWKRLMNTHYEKLTEAEKDQDRIWADKIMVYWQE